MGTPVKILFFPFISKPFHQTARQNPPKSWAIMGFPVMSVEFHGKRGPNIRSSNTVTWNFLYFWNECETFFLLSSNCFFGLYLVSMKSLFKAGFFLLKQNRKNNLTTPFVVQLIIVYMFYSFEVNYDKIFIFFGFWLVLNIF